MSFGSRRGCGSILTWLLLVTWYLEDFLGLAFYFVETKLFLMLDKMTLGTKVAGGEVALLSVFRVAMRGA
jgi:hypothetical protein